MNKTELLTEEDRSTLIGMIVDYYNVRFKADETRVMATSEGRPLTKEESNYVKSVELKASDLQQRYVRFFLDNISRRGEHAGFIKDSMFEAFEEREMAEFMGQATTEAFFKSDAKQLLDNPNLSKY